MSTSCDQITQSSREPRLERGKDDERVGGCLVTCLTMMTCVGRYYQIAETRYMMLRSIRWVGLHVACRPGVLGKAERCSR